MTRFLVLIAALLVSMGLDYLKFVRGRRPGLAGPPAASGTSGRDVDAGAESAVGVDAVAMAALSARVADLERRLSAAAAGLSEEGSTGEGASSGR